MIESIKNFLKKLHPIPVLLAVFAASWGLFLIVELFKKQLYFVAGSAAYLDYHNFVEFSSVAISVSIFGFGWFTYRQSKNNHGLFLGIMFLGIAILDFFHALSFPGMPGLITPSSTEKGIDFWIMARGFTALAFVFSALIPTNSIKLNGRRFYLVAAVLLICFTSFWSVTHYRSYFPHLFIDGKGLTPLKIFLEYFVVTLFLVAFYLYYRRYQSTKQSIWLWYLSAIIVSIFGELAFTLYKSAYDTFNMLGHFYKIIAFILIYRGIFVVSVKDPYNKLDESRELVARSSQYLEDIISTANVIVLGMDRSGKVTMLNKVGEKILGYTFAELKGVNWFEKIVPKKKYPEHFSVLDNSLKKDGSLPETFENPILTYDGEEKMISWQNSVTTAPDGTPTIISFGIDVTDRKKVEKAVNDERKLFMAGPNIAFKWKNLEGWPVEYVSPNIKKQFGYDPKDFTSGRIKYASVIHPDDLSKISAEVEEYGRKGKEAFEQDYRIASANGEYRWVHDVTVVDRNEKGKIVGYQGHIHDITNRKIMENSLLESEMKFSTAFYNSPNLMSITVPETGEIIDINEAFCKFFGYSRKELLGRTTSDLHMWADPKQRDEIVKTMNKKGIANNFEVALRVRFGAIRYAVDSVSFININDKKYMLSVASDVTDRKKVESKLQESEEKYRNVVERADDGIVIVQDGVIKYGNKALERIAGEPLSQILHKPFTKYVEKNVIPEVQKNYENRLQGKNFSSRYETILVSKQKKRVFAEIDAGLITYEGRPADLIIIHDITNRKMSENKLKESLGELAKSKMELEKEVAKDEAILSSVGEGVVVTNDEGTIVMLNRSAEEMVGCKVKEMVGKSFKECRIVADDKGAVLPSNRSPFTLALDGKANSNNYIVERKDGVKFPAFFSVAPVILNKKIMGTVGVFRDITREKEIDRAKTEFVSVASHQLRTPLTGIKWLSELAYKTGLNEKTKSYIDEIYASNERMIRLVNDLLNVSRIDTGRKFLIAPNRVDIILLLKNVIKEQSQAALLKKIKIKVDADSPKKLFVPIDEVKIQQVFGNLIGNAVKYSKENKNVSIHVENNKTEVVFSVKDEGIGIPQGQKSRVFEKFFRADNAVLVRADGTGLGLYIVKAIVEGHGGRIWFETEEGFGSTFYFTLPLKQKK